MRSLFVILINIFCNTLLILIPLDNYAQTVEVKTGEGGTKIVIQKTGPEIVRVVPSSGVDYQTGSIKSPNSKPAVNKADSFDWELNFSAAGKVFKDVSFANPLTGYLVTELGAVYKTTNGGDNWTSIMNLGFPYYWYGVDALTSDTVVISGFNNQGNINSGVVRWSYDGGTTWTDDIILHIPNGVGWLSHIHFFDSRRGIVSAEFSGGIHYTSTGGKDTTSWEYVQVNSDLGWFSGNIDTDTSGNVFTTGYHFARSSDFGVTWTSGPPADNVFDGGVDFLDSLLTGLTGGGQISAPVSGWAHKTSDGGVTWSQRLYAFPYPVRAVKLFDDTLALAFGGNLYDEAGGIYVTADGGLNWDLDVNTSAEMFSYDIVNSTPDSLTIWAAGSTGGGTGFTGKLYRTSRGTPVGVNETKNQLPSAFQLYQNYPNPFNPATTINYSLPWESTVILKVFDILGNEIVVLVNEEKPAGQYEVTWSAGALPSGVYFYQIRAGNFVEIKKMTLLK